MNEPKPKLVIVGSHRNSPSNQQIGTNNEAKKHWTKAEKTPPKQYSSAEKVSHNSTGLSEHTDEMLAKDLLLILLRAQTWYPTSKTLRQGYRKLSPSWDFEYSLIFYFLMHPMHISVL